MVPMDKRVSPKRAVQDWLTHTEWSCSKDQIKPSEDVAPCLTSIHDRGDGRGLATELDLLSPFRHMDQRKHNSNPSRPQRLKRKRNPSSPLRLEPADDHLSVGDDSRICGCSDDDVDDESTTKGLLVYADSPPHSPSSSSIRFEEYAPKSYERRPRRKTKETRYDLKDEKKSKARNEERPRKQKKKRKRKEKTGGTLLHNFSATNVSQGRLTVGTGAMARAMMNLISDST